MSTTSPKESIRQLFYSTQKANRDLAFELAKGAHCYEEMVQEFYEALRQLPPFVRDKKRWLLLAEEHCEEQGVPFPSTVAALQQAQIEQFCKVYFQKKMHLGHEYDSKMTLKEFPPVLLSCSFIQYLDLSNHDIRELPADLHPLSQLKGLKISGNKQLRLTPSIAHLYNLEELCANGIPNLFKTLATNQLEVERYDYQIPAYFQNLQQLQQLHLREVTLRALPTWLPKLTQLKVLEVAAPKAEAPYLELPESLVQLPALEKLIIEAYTINLPSQLDRLQSLMRLQITGVSNMSSKISNLKKLTTLDLSYMAYEMKLGHIEGYNSLLDVIEKGVPEGLSRIQIYGLEWIKQMHQLRYFRFHQLHESCSLTEVEQEELKAALPSCRLDV